MPERVRAWTIWRSFQLALIVGGMAGMITIGVTYNSFIGDLGPRESLLAGAGVAVLVTLALTIVFDQVSKSVQNVKKATRRKE